MSSLGYLSRRVTLRLLYPAPAVTEKWRKKVMRHRLRLWKVDRNVKTGWREQLTPGLAAAPQERLGKWIKDNVDHRIRVNRF